MTTPPLSAYLAPEGFLDSLIAEVGEPDEIYGRLIVIRKPPIHSVWAENIWLNPVQIQFDSISEAARHLKSVQRNWWPYEFHLHRRHHLIAEKLPHISAKPIDFPTLPPQVPLGSYTLVDQHSLLYSNHCSSPFPNGAPQFREYKVGPPSRAYLKLFEAFTRLRTWPKPGQTCIDLGGSPGGWTWVLAQLGAKVKAFDRSPLDPGVLALPGVESHIADAFQVTPKKCGPVDWLFSDVICYPDRLLEHVLLWLESGKCQNFICTIKFQGREHYGVIAKFLNIPGSQIFHLHNNKHELTFVRLDQTIQR